MTTRWWRSPLFRGTNLIATVWLAVVALAAIAPSLFTRVDPTEQDLHDIFSGPSKAHVFGTDGLGQDLYSRLVYGSRPVAVGVLIAVIVAVFIGAVVGLVSGYLGGTADLVIARISDILLAIPALLILLVVYTVFPYNVVVGMSVLGVLFSAALMRLVRSITLTTREELYVAAAEVSGLSRWQVITRHLFPRVKATLFVQAALIAAIAILIQTALAFLGFGPRPPEPSWGGLVAEARVSMLRQNWLLVPSGVVIALTVLALTVLGNAARDQSTAVWAPSKLRRQQPRTSRPRTQTHAQIHDSVLQSNAGGSPRELLEVEGLTVGFPTPAGPGEVVSDVSFTVSRGEIFGIVGESGCGKSVTASAVLGMIPGTGIVMAGRCFFEDRDLVELRPDEWTEIRGRRIGFVAQEPMVSLDPTTRVGSQVAEAVRTHHKCSRPIANERAIELLRMVNLPEPRAVARRYPHQLSGGMAQRVAIAFALAGDPDLLVADEPTTALDVTVQAEILALLRRLCSELDMSVLLITHNWGVIAELCDRALVMYAGQVVEQAPSQVLFDGARHPYTLGLLKSNPSLAERGGRLPSIEGTVPSPADWPTGCRFSDRCYAATDACRAAVPEIERLGDGAEVRCIRWRELQRSAA